MDKTKARPSKNGKVSPSANPGPNSASLEAVSNINPTLRPWVLPVEAIRPDPNNSRKHTDRNIEAIRNSLKEFGQQTPIVLNRDKEVIKGNGTLEAALALGWTEIAAIPSNLTSKRLETGYKVADNKSGDLGGWNYEILAQQFKEYDLNWQGLGWEQWELDPLLGAQWNKPAIEGDPESPDQKGSAILFTAEQREVVDRAILKIRSMTDNKDATDGRCVELICADFLAGH
jgi:hypothetical protein